MMTTKSGADLELPENPEARRAAIKNVYPVEIRHPECDGIAFYYRTLPVRGREFFSNEARYASGEIPNRVHPVARCESCGEEVRASELTWRGKSW